MRSLPLSKKMTRVQTDTKFDVISVRSVCKLNAKISFSAAVRVESEHRTACFKRNTHRAGADRILHLRTVTVCWLWTWNFDHPPPKVTHAEITWAFVSALYKGKFQWEGEKKKETTNVNSSRTASQSVTDIKKGKDKNVKQRPISGGTNSSETKWNSSIISYWKEVHYLGTTF